MRIACIGEAMIELSMAGEDAQLGVAGDTLNTAIYLHREAPALQVEFVTCLGDDPFSQRISDFIASQGVGTDTIHRIAGSSPGLYAITTTEDGERSFTYWRNASAARQLFADLDFSILAGFDAVYLSGISMAILPHPVRTALVAWLETAQVKVIYDSNYRPRLWENEAQAQQITKAMWDRADVALPSIDDEMALFGETAAQVETRFARHRGQGALKRGENGPMSLGSQVTQAYPPAERVIDTTAAGDSFNGGYLGARLSGKSQADALMAGHQLAAKVVQHRGAIMPE
ncbi:sugar kinase [Sulfitobacter geojensis]|uniref:sugar kinase n=1 Tax=Sulfitobacter geojensis TaxID=1342299 RepID=UPI00183D9580|nr:sugar kinase [Sulfitobacter geojensis]NYI27128.1 2-dehydro-3-deoxygluconokinase [Sulfitobacter geojensis]